MPHYYDKAPPRFAKDPWAWDYTRDRLEQNSGLPYDKWEGKHFAGAAAMYKNVIKKYGASIQNGVVTLPKECIDCGVIGVHYQDDYICRSCRDAIEAAPTFEEATKTITNPGALDAIREQLYESLGHAAKDRKKGRVNTPMPSPIVSVRQADLGRQAVAAVETVVAEEPVTGTGKVSRNYKAMGEDNLRRAVAELEAGTGEAMRKVKPGEDPMDHLEAALRVAQEKGWAI